MEFSLKLYKRGYPVPYKRTPSYLYISGLAILINHRPYTYYFKPANKGYHQTLILLPCHDAKIVIIAH